jgi:hypothetical protein
MNINVIEVPAEFMPVKIEITLVSERELNEVGAGGQHMKMEIGDIVVSAVRKFAQGNIK